ncbi:hypothetical protein EI94DRAFT_1593579 [Lactarius quietus]|nr:hypothetical protein EI94DRAFT_1593579 [Lactarius quietus]
MWLGYMEEADKYDTLVSDLWKDDATGVLVFTGLLSAVVATFLVSSYPMLSSDSGDETVYLLKQISQQLTAISPNGTHISPTPYPTYSPSLSIILVNSFWSLSLVLSISSAVLATLMQQWARRYIRLPQIPSLPRDKARVRGLLFLGVLQYRMPRTFEAAGLLLHLSVFFFSLVWCYSFSRYSRLWPSSFPSASDCLDSCTSSSPSFLASTIAARTLLQCPAFVGVAGTPLWVSLRFALAGS